MKNYRYHTGVKVSPDGQRQLVVGTAPRQWLDGKMWKPIETDLQTSANSFDLTKSAFEVQIPKRANDTILFGNVGSEFRIKPVCESVEGQHRTPNIILFPNAFGTDIDMQVIVNRKGIRKWIIINKTSKKTLNFDFEIETENLPAIQTKETFSRLTLAKNSDVVTTLRDVRGWDADGLPVKVDSTIVKKSNKLILRKTVTIPDEPKFPITTDASLVVTPHSSDGHIWNSDMGNWDTCHDGLTGLVVDNANYFFAFSNEAMSFRIYRAGISFDTSAIGSGATITSGSIDISAKYVDEPNSPIILTSFTPANETSYAGGDYAKANFPLTNLATGTVTVVNNSYDPYTFTLAAAGLAHIETTVYTTFGIRDYAKDYLDVNPGMMQFNSWGAYIESSESDNDPELTVNYTLPPTAVQVGRGINRCINRGIMRGTHNG